MIAYSLLTRRFCHNDIRNQFQLLADIYSYLTGRKKDQAHPPASSGSFEENHVPKLALISVWLFPPRTRSGSSFYPQTALQIQPVLSCPRLPPCVQYFRKTILCNAAMNKRNFLKTSGALLTGGMLSHLIADEPASTPRTNWSGNYTFSTDHLHLPNDVAGVQQFVKSCDKIKALGAAHSFNGIADSTANQISLKNLKQMSLDTKAKNRRGRSGSQIWRSCALPLQKRVCRS